VPSPDVDGNTGAHPTDSHANPAEGIANGTLPLGAIY